MPNTTRPLPSLAEPDTGIFWKSTKDHKLRYQCCNDCDEIVFFPRHHCTNCLSANLDWHESSGTGTIYSFSVVTVSRDPAFRDKTPYAVALVDLDEGFRMFTNISGITDPINDLHIGQRVSVDWDDHEELSLPFFQQIS